MRTTIFGLWAAAVHAAVLDLGDSSTSSTTSTASCNMTTVETATSGTYTYIYEVDEYTFHATSTVTVLSLGAITLSTTATPTAQPSKRAVMTPRIPRQPGQPRSKTATPHSKRTNAPPGTYNTKRDLQARAAASACSDPTSTVTTTVGSTTTTSTKTNMLSRMARATVTQAACIPENNYGLINGTLNRNFFFGGYPKVVQYSNVTTEECCKKCFESDDGCVAWSYGGTVNNTMPVDGCVMALYEGGCPRMVGKDTIVYKNDRKYAVGVGSCNVQVAYFQG